MITLQGFCDKALIVNSAAASANEPPPSTLTLDKVREMMRAIRNEPPLPSTAIFIAHHLGQLVPNRLLRDRTWHHKRGSYARRVQKKWAKRFGQHRLPHILRAPQGFFVSKWAYEQLRAKCAVSDAPEFYGGLYGGALPRILL